MQILLPPSEGKNTPQSGEPIQLSQLYLADQLTTARLDVMSQLTRISSTEDAFQLLGVSKNLAADVERNTLLSSSATSPAYQVYSGVLFQAAALNKLSAADWKKANQRLLIASALWGFLRPTDNIPSYRLSSSASLPGIGKMASYWHKVFTTITSEVVSSGFLIDCRSGSYQQAFKIPADRIVLETRILKEVNSVEKVVSHFAKHTRGLLAGFLATADIPNIELVDAETAGNQFVDFVLANNWSKQFKEIRISSVKKNRAVLEIVLKD